MTFKYLDVEKIGKAEVIVDIISKGNKEIRPAYPMKPSQIAIHNTGNPGRGANAKMHNVYIHNLASYHPKDTSHVSWHLSVDDKFIYQHIPFNESAWHTGDGSALKSGNRTAIGIEICENPDMDYNQAEENAVQLTAYLREKIPNIAIKKVKGHIEFSGKYCPRVILKRDGSVEKFRYRVENVKKTPVSTVSDYYSVKKGDSLWAIAKAHKTTVEKIKKLNNLKSDTIYPNQKLKLNVKQDVAVSQIVVDGIWGKGTTRALQKALGSIEDGIISGQYRNSVTEAIYGVEYGISGSLVVRKLQAKIGGKVDGYLGKETITELQKYLGTYQDGVISHPSAMVKELQRRLNAGTF